MELLLILIGGIIWERSFGDSGVVYTVKGFVHAEGGGYIIAGMKNGAGYAFRVDEDGDSVWMKEYTWWADSIHLLYSMDEASNKGYVIGGVSVKWWYAYPRGLFIARIDQKGDIIWKKDYLMDTSYYHTSHDGIVRRTRGMGYIFAGIVYSYETNYDIILIKVDIDGDSLWSRTYKWESAELLYDIEETEDGGYIMGGVMNAGSETFGFLYRVDEDGDSLWLIGHLGEKIYDVKEVSDGYIFVGYGRFRHNLVIGKVDKDGNLEWFKDYGGDAIEVGYNILELKQGGYVVSGFTQSYSSGAPLYTDVWVVRFDEEGDTTGQFIHGEYKENECGKYILKDGDSYVVVGLKGRETTDEDFPSGRELYLIKIDTMMGVNKRSDKEIVKDITIAEQSRDYVEFEVSYNSYIDISLYDVQGRKIGDVYSGYVKCNKKITYDWRDLSKGVYFIKAEMGENSITEKVIKIK